MEIVLHSNFIGREINESFQRGFNTDDREIFCKKYHKVWEPTEKACLKCPYFAGVMGGYGHACAWEDVDDAPTFIEHEDRNKELYRVSKLIDAGILKKG